MCFGKITGTMAVPADDEYVYAETRLLPADPGEESTPMKVHIDQQACTGAGYCEQVAPHVFVLEDSGLATVRDAAGAPLPGGGAPAGVEVAEADLPVVQDAIGMCPGACINLTN